MPVSPNSVERLERAIAPLREELLAHPMYEAISSVADLRVFMEQHVFAVWDFMSLLKRLQRHAAGCELPWVPPVDISVARFINEIVLGEECDRDGAGGYLSHFELYLNAMSNISADRTGIDQLIAGLRDGADFATVWSRIPKTASTGAFVDTTINLALHGQVHEVAASFCYGREEVIPDMFSRLVPKIKASDLPVDDVVYYLERHIELDGDEHGALARGLVEALIGDSETKLTEAIAAATKAIEARIELWNGILAEISKLKISPRFPQGSVSRETA